MSIYRVEIDGEKNRIYLKSWDSGQILKEADYISREFLGGNFKRLTGRAAQDVRLLTVCSCWPLSVYAVWC